MINGGHAHRLGVRLAHHQTVHGLQVLSQIPVGRLPDILARCRVTEAYVVWERRLRVVRVGVPNGPCLCHGA